MSYKEVTIVEESDDAYPPPGFTPSYPPPESYPPVPPPPVSFRTSEMQGMHQFIHHQHLQYHRHLDFRDDSGCCPFLKGW
ncbi:hypothetical protein MKW92_023169 [Papaver armeniacum]|nr:hypothetical protein MKW92_023169 [Papaver armeniacum]